MQPEISKERSPNKKSYREKKKRKVRVRVRKEGKRRETDRYRIVVHIGVKYEKREKKIEMRLIRYK